jgi:hypothetical protein
MLSSLLRLPQLEGNLKHLKKHYQHLDEDLTILVEALLVWLVFKVGPVGRGDDSHVMISGYGASHDIGRALLSDHRISESCYLRL